MVGHNEFGKWGEMVAREYLLTQGYAISGENQRLAGVEIDFIAMRDDRICFVEVKTRSSDFLDPAEAVDRRKQARLAKAADAYMQGRDLPFEPQFDIIVVIGSPDSYRLEHIPDAFYPPLNGGR